MILFCDGPAQGVSLSLRSAPKILRVTRNLEAEEIWDALDQPEDEPSPGEEIYVYVRKAQAFVGHIDWNDGRGRRGEPFINAEYLFPDTQPLNGEGRTKERFDNWCKSVGMWQE